MHEIRFCKSSEYYLLINFITTYWKKDHIFTKDKQLLDWQHLDEEEERYNFVVAYNKNTEEFDAILGFIPTSQYDKDLKKHHEIWLAIWKIKDSMSDKVSGIQLLFYMNSKLKPSTTCAIGITESVRSIYDAFKYKRGNLMHFYITSSMYKPGISNIKKIFLHERAEKNYKIKEISFEAYKDEFQKIILQSEESLIKSSVYIYNRFMMHPTYRYTIYGIFLDNILVSFFLSRKIIINNNSVIRIVDYYGEFINSNLSIEFQSLLTKESAEYIDLLCNISNILELENMGFKKKLNTDVIPEYFEPLVQKNVTIEFAFKSKKNIRIFKADSDQDRPTQTLSENK